MPAITYPQWSDPPLNEIIIRGGWLFDGVSNSLRKNTGIVIREGKIVEIDADLQDDPVEILRLIGKIHEG